MPCNKHGVEKQHKWKVFERGGEGSIGDYGTAS